uniref:RNA-directed DNA polymerase, eukaryota n=1 Tax=Tanacetum cinerariifolium TaxID=118510 RepID=A0A699GW25_TANCI|nr:RNA-directed DNA polymerase, eukaryota [Tanacetum cinerariifolium]
MASNTGCSARTFPITYLGLPIGSNMSLMAIWKLLVDIFHSKLSSWKASLLSYGGRFTLLKTVLGSLVIRALHGSEGGFEQNGYNFNGLWSKIVGTSNYLHSSSILPVDSIRYQVAEISNIEVREGMDKCIWSISQDGNFTVGSLRCLIDDHMLPYLDSKTTWDKSLPRKVNIFMWRLNLDRLPHRLNLSARRIEIPQISCSSCNGNVESNSHIFFDCFIAKEVWKLIRRWCEDVFPPFKSNNHRLDWLSSWHASRDKKHRLYLIFAASLWFI